MKVSFTEETKTDKCPSCGIKYINHLGLISTCKELQELKKELKSIQESMEYIIVRNNNNTLLNNIHGRICRLTEKYEKR